MEQLSGVRRRRQNGHAFLEFAIGSGMFVAMFTGAYQFGYTFHVYEGLASAVRAGARYGAIAVYDASVPTVNSSPATNFVTIVRNVTVYGDPLGTANGARAVVRGLLPQHVMVNVTYQNSLPYTVKVSINGFSLSTAFRNWVARNKPQATFIYMGRYDPPMS